MTAYKDPNLPAAPAVSEKADWAAPLQILAAEDAEILLAAVMTMYPHETLSPLVYRRVIVHFDKVAAANPAAAAALAGFCDSLRAAGPLPFWELAESYRVQALKKIEAEKTFFFVQRMAIRYLYDDVEVWAAFGYEGASVHLGGYVKRGFDDLDWLPPLPNDI